jgi:hypothetical protein
MNEEERRKNETLPNIPTHGYSHVPCLRLSVAENILFARNAAAFEITESQLKEIVNGSTKEKTKT